jgi:dTDP-4-amino-4,6-dideoxygalactose transaminase
VVTTRTIPLARPYLDGREEELVLDVLRSDSLACGPVAPAFERAFADRVGTEFAVACSSGTAGLHVALHRLRLQPGDEVITSSFSFIASANVILLERATAVFADIDERTFNVDPAAVEAAITPRTRAIIPVHIFGYPCDIEAVSRVAAGHGVPVIEDACEAIGCTVDGRHVGTHGNPAVWGFYPNKQLTTGEGGAITTDDPDLARELRSLVNQGRSDNGDWLVHQRLGFNYRMDEMSAAVGLAQLEKLDTMLERRRRVAERYDELLAGIDGVELPYRGPQPRSWFIYFVRLGEGIDRTAVAAGLAARGVSTRPYLPAIHTQPEYRERFGYREGMLPVTERVSASTLALPFFIQLEDDDIAYVAEALREVLADL